MNDIEISFDDMTGPTDKTPDEKRERGPTMWIRSPAKNSVELSLMEAQLQDIDIDVEFREDDYVPPPDMMVETDPLEQRARQAIGRFWHAHISLARSMADGPDATYARYCELCKQHGMVPVRLRDYVMN